VRLRPLEPDDIEACIEVFEVAQRALYERTGQPWVPSDPGIMGRLLAHLRETNPERAWLAEAGSPVAFGMAVQRDEFRFLSFLFVRPERQAKGLGRELLGRCMGEHEPRTTRATCVDALQPISTGLYAEQGIVPRVPFFTLIGRPERGGLPRPSGRLAGAPFESAVRETGADRQLRGAVDSIDRRTVGFARPEDHHFWRREGRRGFLYRTSGSSEPIGYGYVQPSGRVGPIALLDGSLMVAVLGDLFRRVRPPGAWQVVVPGDSASALVALLHAGLRFEGSPALYCATRQTIDFERYLPAGFALI
jgi:GNAT superfamily N-acetyltransferase